jgi:hypothetical protein
VLGHGYGGLGKIDDDIVARFYFGAEFSSNFPEVTFANVSLDGFSHFA